MWDAVVFDLDGTLADTANDLIDAANATFSSLGLGRVLTPETDDQVAMQGGGRAMLRHGFARLGQTISDDEIERLYPDLVQHYANNLCTHSYLYPGCVAALVFRPIRIGRPPHWSAFGGPRCAFRAPLRSEPLTQLARERPTGFRRWVN